MTDRTEQKIARGKRAEQLLNDDLLKEGFENLKAEYLKAWSDSAPHEEEYREKLWYARRVVDLVRKHLTLAMDDGKIARHELDALRR